MRFRSAPSALRTAHALPTPLREKPPAAASVPDPSESSAAPRSSATAAFCARTHIAACTRHTPPDGSAARASPCPSPLHPDTARTIAWPGGTRFPLLAPFLSYECHSWHHLDPSTPSSNLLPLRSNLSRSAQPQFFSNLTNVWRQPLSQGLAPAG